MNVKEEQHTPCEVVEVGEYDPDKPHYGKFIRVQFDGEEGTRRYTLSRDLNGDAPKVGAKIRLLLQSYMKPMGARDGSGRVNWVEKRRVIGAAAA
jgi:hypothetical protein